jgi:hypothetical protein
MSTIRELITSSLRLINVVASGEAPSADDIDITKFALNSLIDSWSNNRLMIYTMNPYEFPVQAGKSKYTLGTGGDWDTPRPMAIENAYTRLNSGTIQQLDIKLKDLTDEQYGDIAVKNTPSTFPFAFYDNGNFPLRTITLFPIPTTSVSILMWLRQPLIDLTSLDTEVSYPPGYERCFRYNLAVEVAPEFGKTVPENVMMSAMASKLEIERLNSNPVYLRGDGGNTVRGKSAGIPSAIITGGFFNPQ